MSELQKLLNATTESGIKKADLEDFGKKIIKETLLQAHPVGSIEIRVDNVNPSTLYGGTWEKIEGKFLLGSSSSYTLGKSGGSATHTLTINEIPAHTHNIYSGYGEAYNGHQDALRYQFWGAEGSGQHWDNRFAQSTGGGQSFNIMPPYLSVSIWKRVS